MIMMDLGDHAEQVRTALRKRNVWVKRICQHPSDGRLPGYLDVYVRLAGVIVMRRVVVNDPEDVYATERKALTKIDEFTLASDA